MNTWTVKVNNESVESGEDLAGLRAAFLNHLADNRTPDCSSGSSVEAFVRGERVKGFDENGAPVCRALVLVEGRRPNVDAINATHWSELDEHVSLKVVEDLGVVRSVRGALCTVDPMAFTNPLVLDRDGGGFAP